MMISPRHLLYVLFADALVLAVFVLWSVVPLFGARPVITSTRLLDRQGGVLYTVADDEFGARTEIALRDMSPSLIDAIIASEDKRFYKHHGVDVRSLVRVTRDVFVSGETYGGASTIEQQLIKTLYFRGRSRSVLQKARESVGAIAWSLSHSKDETLELYLNSIYFGNRAYGVSAAAQTYFHKAPTDLTLAESAFLVGLIPSPSAYDPYRHRDVADARQASVLRRMGQTVDGNEPIVLFKPQTTIRAPHFVFRVLEDVSQTIPDIETGGYTIYTTIDPGLQATTEAAIDRRLLQLVGKNAGNAAAMALDPKSGEVLAYVGSADYFASGIAGAVDMVQAKRQPGSTLKPFLYATAFMKGAAPANIIADLPVRFESADGRPYYPRNYNYRYFGPVSLRQALGSSLNIPAVKLLDRIGLISFFDAAERFGFSFPETPDHYGLSLVLGGGEVRLFDAVSAYGRLALYSHDLQPTMVREVRDADDIRVYAAAAQDHKPLFVDEEKAEAAAALVADVLSDASARALAFGEANLLDIGKPIAAKTGTTKDFRDNWAFGYTPDFVLGVWVGNADNSPMQAVSGITGAVPIWHDIMRYRFDRAGSINWPAADGLVTRTVCAASGMLATEQCVKQRSERFIAGTEPTQTDTWYQTVAIDTATGLRDNGACRGPVRQEIYFLPPSEYQAWLASSGNKQPPAADCTGAVVTADQPLSILSPLDGDQFEINPLIDRASQSIPFIAGGQAKTYRWSLNGQAIETANPQYLWPAQPGDYELTLEDRQIHFSVR